MIGNNPNFCKTCASSGQFNTGEPGCILHKCKIDPEKDFCSWHNPKSTLINCSVCKTLISSKELYYWIDNSETTEGILICKQCFEKIGTCITCRYQKECGFLNDHSEPQMVMKTVQNGFMTMQTQVKNPNLIAKHCINCRCSYPGIDEICQREEHGINCSSWMLQ